MSDEESAHPRDDEARGREAETRGGAHTRHSAEFRMELVDSLPGGRAVIGVEQEGEFVWLASKDHVSEQARDEFIDQISRIVGEGWWIQNWPSN